MNKWTIAICLLLGLSVTTKAQTFTGMLVGGFNMSQIDGDRLHGYNKIGLNVGGRVSAPVKDWLNISMELLYSQQGASSSLRDDISSTYDKVRLKFVEVPVMVNISDWKVLGSLGVSYGRMINYEVIDNLGTDITELEDYNDNTFSIVFGGTYFFAEDWGLNIRWSKNLSNLKKKTEVGASAQNFIGKTLGIRLYYIL